MIFKSFKKFYPYNQQSNQHMHCSLMQIWPVEIPLCFKSVKFRDISHAYNYFIGDITLSQIESMLLPVILKYIYYKATKYILYFETWQYSHTIGWVNMKSIK